MSDFAESLQQALGPGYRILRELGGGGMSRVYLAEEVALDRRVVVKVLPPELAEGVASGRFRREIQHAAQLQHPHIVPLLSSGTAGGLLYYVMPYVEGETLRARLARDGAQTAPEAARVARDVVEALTYAHSQGVVHRDIKPENILLSSGHALVLDFGVAKALRAAVEPGHGTTAGVALGTPLYMSPEQAAGGEVDERADLYALGVVLYELLAGRPPFQSDSAYDVMAAHIADRPDPLRKHRRDIPPGLEAVVMRCLAKRADDRFRTAGALLTELDAFATPASGRVARGRGRRRRRGQVQWGARRGRVLYAAGALGGTLAALAGLWHTGVLGGRTLVAEGALGERERVIVADFANRTGDSTLGQVVTEAFRLDLAQSRAVSVLPPAAVRQALVRMRRDSVPTVGFELAREVALRTGVKAVVGGEVAAVGGGFILSARIVNAETGEVLAGFRETAGGPTAIIPTVDRVSKQLRRRIGESVAALADARPLEQVTTASLDALRRYSQARQAMHAGQYDRAALLLEEAIQLDSAFASAYRALGVVYENWKQEPARMVDALLRAYELRDRLPDRERHFAEAQYFSELDYRPERVAAAYEAVLQRNPDDAVALTNLGNLFRDLGAVDKALPLHRRVLSQSPAAMFFMNVAYDQAVQGDAEGINSTLAAWASADSANPSLVLYRGYHAFTAGRYDTAGARFREVADRQAESLTLTALAHEGLASVARVRGRLAEAERHQAEAIRARAAGDSAARLVSLQREIIRAGHDILIRGGAAAGVRRLDAALRITPLDSLSPALRPYLEVAYLYAVAGHAAAARRTLGERVRELRRLGRGGAAILLRDGHEPQPLVVQGRIDAAEDRPDEALAVLRRAESRRETLVALPDLGAVHDHAGQADSAIAAYERYLARGWLARHETDGWHLPRILFRLGELYETRGDRVRAADYYSQFAELWRECDPDLQPRVREARRRLAALTTEAGSR
ncbi:MAG TPA: protein kinase [Gemmatimonadales bacterium]|nr:protein kinase [Gemmatimonadales bacterium]